jgi:ectoine hydrolase
MSELRFPPEEFARRLQSVQNEMVKRGLDVLVVTDPSNAYYLTGYEAWSFYTPQVVLVGVEADSPIWFGRYMDAPSARRTTHLPDDHVRPYPDAYVQAPNRHPFQLLATLIQEMGWDRKTIGLESDSYYYSPRAHYTLTGALPATTFEDADLLVNWVRIIKSAREIQYMEEAGRITERMLSTAVDAVAPGVRECDVVGALYHAQMSGTPEFGGVYSTSPMFFCADERAGEPHAIWTDRPLRSGVPINLEISGCRHRYHAPISRTIYLGNPPKAYRDLAESVVEGLNAALDAVQPGRTCEEIESVWRTTIARRGIEKESRIGYSTGIGFPPTWGERTASLRPGDRTVLQPNMAFHMMTGVWQKDTGVTITQSFHVTDSGHHPLTTAPRELIVKD